MLSRFLSVLSLLACLFCVGCGNTSHPGTWNQAEIEAYMLKTENPKMSEVSISTDPAGGYTGTGKAADGETFKLTIKQNADLKRLSWNAKGDRGTVIDDASYEFVK
jgi:lipopolysaccharide export LptBFGC system permease protein LptF